jgi:hypothetical protein
LLEAGTAPFNAERAVRWLESREPGTHVAGALLTAPASGGAPWLAANRLSVRVGAGAEPFERIMLANRGAPLSAIKVIRAREMLVAGGDTAIIEPVDLPDAPGSLVIYRPREKWLYLNPGLPLQIEAALRHARAEGWQVEHIGSGRGMMQPLPPEPPK